MNKTYFSTSKILSRRLPVWTKFFPAILILLFASCKKESDVGIDIQPEEDLIGLYTTDTMTLVTYTVLEDSLRTDETPTVVLGTCQDDFFGTSMCGVFSQFSIPNNLSNINFDNGNGAIFDSAVLMIAYKYDFYGDTMTQQTFNVYQMTDKLEKDSIYYSNHPKSFYPQVIGTKTFDPHPRKYVVVNGDTVPAHVRIPIDQNWGQMVFDQSGGPNLANQQNWVDFMNGLYIQSGSTGKSLLYFNLLDSLTGLRMYYHTASDSTSFTFIVNSATPYFSYYQHNYTTATPAVHSDLAAQLATPGYQSPMTFIQSNAGVRTKVQFPYLNDWYNNLGYPAAINKAELVIFGINDPIAPDNFPLNTRMFLTSIDSLNREHLLIDMFESSSYYGGSLNTTTNVYKINMARYVQDVVSGTLPNNGIYIKEIFGTENGRRSMIGSGNGQAGGYKMYLHLVYTRIN